MIELMMLALWVRLVLATIGAVALFIVAAVLVALIWALCGRVGDWLAVPAPAPDEEKKGA